MSLFIAVRGESVRVEARAHSAAYAEAFQQRSHELAAGLADRGLALGTLTADAPGDRGRQSSAGDAGQPGAGRGEPHAHGQPDRRGGGGPERDPDQPRPRGLRAIA
jgi:hypothetical protein